MHRWRPKVDRESQSRGRVRGRVLACLALATLCLATPTTEAGTAVFADDDTDFGNPHQGFMLWATGSFDPADNHYGSHLYHLYLPWREIETSDEQYDWNAFEARHLEPILAADPEATFVLRPVADYPDGPGSGLDLYYAGGDVDRDFPAFLSQPPLNIATHRYASCDGDGPGVTPDWNAPEMQRQLQQFIDAFGARYDGDPRITAVQFGLLGLWGEWHQSGCEAWRPSTQTKALVRERYRQAFQYTPLQTRYARTGDTGEMQVGFHEDFFPSFTTWCVYGFPACDDSGDWNLEWNFSNSNPDAADNWVSAPISGESPLPAQQDAWIDDQADLLRVLRDYHFSFLGPAGKHETPNLDTELLPIKQALGYRFRLRSASWPDTIIKGAQYRLDLELLNDGSAPLYHAFPLELQLLDDQGTLLWRQALDVDLTALPLSQSPTAHQPGFVVVAAPVGRYHLTIVIADPDGSGAVGIRFQSRGQDWNGRLALGTVRVVEPDCFGTDVVLMADDVTLGADLVCRATRSIVVEPGVRIGGHANVSLIAPSVRMSGPFSVDAGSRFHARTGSGAD